MLRTLLRGLLGLVLLADTAGAAAHGSKVVDVLGREVVVPHHVERVLLGFYFEDFLAIVGPDAYDRVVAISKATWHDWRQSQWQSYLKVIPRIDALEDVGEVDSGTFNIEKALAVRPDVAILAAWQYRALGDVVARFDAAGIPVVVVDYNAQEVERHVASTRAIGAVMGATQRAEQLAQEYADAVADVRARVARSNAPRKKVYVELGNKGAAEYGNSYRDHMWGRVIETAGGENIANIASGKSTPLNPEHVLASNPDVILIAGSAWTSSRDVVLMGFGVDPGTTRARLRPYTERPGWSRLSAVASREVHALYHGGARTLYDYTFLQYIAKRLHPEAFADVDPVANHRRFYARWLPIQADGTFILALDPELR
ncbi:MAG: ABC transporter substrate-binding protein [Ectothiorhodospiraceae bacterium]|nr:ABC transporter substrate-binding protein [Ectothiorhodospiraceae bacterium]